VLRHGWRAQLADRGAFRVQQLLVRQAVRLGGSLSRRIPTGEVVSVGSHDVERVGNALDVTARLAGALVSFVVVAVLMLRTSVVLGLVVLVGVPLLSVAIAPVLRPLHARQTQQRELVGSLTSLGADTVSGLRVLRGIGGEEEFSRRYARSSQEVRGAGVAVGRVQSLLDAAQYALPGIFVVAVTWLGARLAVEGTISVGELVAFYGYAAFLVVPVRTATEAADKFTRAHVAVRRVLTVLTLEPDIDPGAAAGSASTEPPYGRELVDVASGLVVRPGGLTAVVAALPEDATAIVERLGRFREDGLVTLGGVPLDRMPLAAVRRRVLVSDSDPRLFTGPLGSELDPTGQATATEVTTAIHTASAEDVLEALPHGLDTEVEERGRSFSGGQRQRLVLTRALWPSPTSWFWTSRRARSTPTPRRGSPTGSGGSARGARQWSARPARCCSTAPTTWCSCWVAGSSPKAPTAS
jgi:ABC-type multidrug transport system fused ATPase/permease subunit